MRMATASKARISPEPEAQLFTLCVHALQKPIPQDLS